MDSNNIIRFDWAAKRLLRNKANYAVLEGLVTVLLGEKISIIEILESESNQSSASDKFNRRKTVKTTLFLLRFSLLANGTIYREYYMEFPKP